MAFYLVFLFGNTAWLLCLLCPLSLTIELAIVHTLTISDFSVKKYFEYIETILSECRVLYHVSYQKPMFHQTDFGKGWRGFSSITEWGDKGNTLMSGSNMVVCLYDHLHWKGSVDGLVWKHPRAFFFKK